MDIENDKDRETLNKIIIELEHTIEQDDKEIEQITEKLNSKIEQKKARMDKVEKYKKFFKEVHKVEYSEDIAQHSTYPPKEEKVSKRRGKKLAAIPDRYNKEDSNIDKLRYAFAKNGGEMNLEEVTKYLLKKNDLTADQIRATYYAMSQRGITSKPEKHGARVKLLI